MLIIALLKWGKVKKYNSINIKMSGSLVNCISEVLTITNMNYILELISIYHNCTQ